VIPVGPSGSQSLMLYEREGDHIRSHTLADVSFVPLLAGRA
jgi:protein-L-isoaspartate O-methyltransferase